MLPRRHIRQLDLERGIAVGVEGDLASAKIHARLAHCAIEHKGCKARPLRNLNIATIPSFADPRQRTAPARLFRGNLFAVFLDGDDLPVDRHVEGACNRPVVRNLDRLPDAVRLRAPAELPVCKDGFARQGAEAGGSHCRCNEQQNRLGRSHLTCLPFFAGERFWPADFIFVAGSC